MEVQAKLRLAVLPLHKDWANIRDTLQANYLLQIVERKGLFKSRDLTYGEALVIITDEKTPNLQICEKLRKNRQHHIPTILVTDNFDELDNLSSLKCVDVIVPNDPKYIVYHVQKLLKEWQQKQELANELLAQRRMSNELELIKNALVRNVSHELRTPLLQIKGSVSMMAEDVGESSLTEMAKVAIAKLEILTNNITLLGASMNVSLHPTTLRESVNHAKRNLGRTWLHKAEAKRIEIDIPEDIPPVVADKQSIFVIIQQLMDNALKFSDDHIKVYATADADSVWLYVQDFGIGIDESQLNKIFDAFFQIDSDETRRYGGLGIGLAVAKLLAESHNSEIEVESEISIGSTFSFRLPIVNL